MKAGGECSLRFTIFLFDQTISDLNQFYTTLHFILTKFSYNYLCLDYIQSVWEILLFC